MNRLVEVYLVRTSNRIDGLKSVFNYYDKLFASMTDKKVLIKPNFNTADPNPASTNISVVKSVITHLQSIKAKKIIVAERSGPADSHETMVSKGLFELQESLGGFDILNFASMDTSLWIKYESEGSHWKDGFLYPKILDEVDAVITLPCLKTHQHGGHFTLSLKLSVGFVPRDGYTLMKELHSSPSMRKMIAEINACYSPSLVILDGITAFVDGGPSKGTEVQGNVILASTDRIAIDAVGVAILRDLGTTPEVTSGPIFEQEQLAHAVKLNLGIKSPSEIEIIGLDDQSKEYAKKLMEILNP